MVLSIAAMEKLLKSAGADRVSVESAKALQQELERYAKSLGERAVTFSKHAGRKTLKAEDIQLAAKSEV